MKISIDQLVDLVNCREIFVDGKTVYLVWSDSNNPDDKPFLMIDGKMVKYLTIEE